MIRLYNLKERKEDLETFIKDWYMFPTGMSMEQNPLMSHLKQHSYGERQNLCVTFVCFIIAANISNNIVTFAFSFKLCATFTIAKLLRVRADNLRK